MVVKQSNKTGRREIAEEFGFDLKFAAHGFRLAGQGAELLRTGRITFPRPDRDFLRAVRFGQVYGPDDLERLRGRPGRRLAGPGPRAGQDRPAAEGGLRAV